MSDVEQESPRGVRAEELPARAASVPRMFYDRVAASPDREAYRYPTGAGTWASYTWTEAAERVSAIAAGLLDLGIQPGDRVGILAGTSVTWILADTGILAAGAATTTVYPSTPAEDVAFIVGDAGCRVVVVDDETQLAKLRAHRTRLGNLMHVVVLNGDGGPAPDGWAMSIGTLEQRGRDHLENDPAAVENRVAGIGPEDLATLIYTSGTTGRPKGVRLVHDCWTYEAAAIDALGILGPDDVQYLWLPLAHAFGKVLTSAHIGIGFVTAVNGDLTRLVDDLAQVRPTFMAAAPRIFEKVHNRVVGQVEEAGGAKRRIFRWALGVGLEVSRRQQQGSAAGPLLRAQHRLADRLVFSTVRDRFGGRIRYFISGSAALSPEIAAFFHAMGILILEGYGLTETSASIYVNRPQHFRFGSVGLPLPGMAARLAPDGELLVRGPAVMRGYHGLPEESAAVLTTDGWLHTGDIGTIDDDGVLRITDRKKDLIKTSGGKYVAPQAIEIRLKALCPYVSQVVVHGDRRNFCTALITVDEDEIGSWARHRGMGEASYQELVGSPEVRALLDGCVDQLNATLARWETIKKFAILPRDLDIEHGELTPSLKVRRRVVEEEYRPLLDEMYAGAVAGS